MTTRSSRTMNDEGVAEHYQVLEELGRGSFGVVYKAIEKATGETVAIKHVSTSLLLTPPPEDSS